MVISRENLTDRIAVFVEGDAIALRFSEFDFSSIHTDRLNEVLGPFAFLSISAMRDPELKALTRERLVSKYYEWAVRSGGYQLGGDVWANNLEYLIRGEIDLRCATQQLKAWFEEEPDGGTIWSEFRRELQPLIHPYMNGPDDRDYAAIVERLQRTAGKTHEGALEALEKKAAERLRERMEFPNGMGLQNFIVVWNGGQIDTDWRIKIECQATDDVVRFFLPSQAPFPIENLPQRKQMIARLFQERCFERDADGFDALYQRMFDARREFASDPAVQYDGWFQPHDRLVANQLMQLCSPGAFVDKLLESVEARLDTDYAQNSPILESLREHQADQAKEFLEKLHPLILQAGRVVGTDVVLPSWGKAVSSTRKIDGYLAPNNGGIADTFNISVRSDGVIPVLIMFEELLHTIDKHMGGNGQPFSHSAAWAGAVAHDLRNPPPKPELPPEKAKWRESIKKFVSAVKDERTDKEKHDDRVYDYLRAMIGGLKENHALNPNLVSEGQLYRQAEALVDMFHLIELLQQHVEYNKGGLILPKIDNKYEFEFVPVENPRALLRQAFPNMYLMTFGPDDPNNHVVCDKNGRSFEVSNPKTLSGEYTEVIPFLKRMGHNMDDYMKNRIPQLGLVQLTGHIQTPPMPPRESVARRIEKAREALPPELGPYR